MTEAFEFLLEIGKQYGLVVMLSVLFSMGVIYVSFKVINIIREQSKEEIRRIADERNEYKDILFELKGIKRLSTKKQKRTKKEAK